MKGLGEITGARVGWGRVERLAPTSNQTSPSSFGTAAPIATVLACRTEVTTLGKAYKQQRPPTEWSTAPSCRTLISYAAAPQVTALM